MPRHTWGAANRNGLNVAPKLHPWVGGVGLPGGGEGLRRRGDSDQGLQGNDGGVVTAVLLCACVHFLVFFAERLRGMFARAASRSVSSTEPTAEKSIISYGRERGEIAKPMSLTDRDQT